MSEKVKAAVVRRREAAKPDDGFHWEEWRNGRLWSHGWHNGTKLDGKDASKWVWGLDVAIPVSALDDLLKKES